MEAKFDFVENNKYAGCNSRYDIIICNKRVVFIGFVLKRHVKRVQAHIVIFFVLLYRRTSPWF